MKISIGADHAGFLLKQHIAEQLRAQGNDVEDVGTFSTESTDYPDYAKAVADSVATGRAERGILVCSTGAGIAMAANKVHGVRAAIAYNAEEAALMRQHNDANVIALAARYTDPATADNYVHTFLTTPFEAGGRHERRVNKIKEMEQC